MLALLLAACGSGPPPGPLPESWTDPQLDATSAPTPVPLHLLPPTDVALPARTLPDGTALGEPRRVEVELRPSKKGFRRFTAPMPFNVAVSGEFDEGEMEVRVDGTRVAHGKGLPRWESDRYTLNLVLPPGEGVPEVEASWPGLEKRLRRRDPVLSGLDPEAFVRMALTLADTTRDGLLVPAPGAVAWTVRVPQRKPVFDAWMALDPARVSDVTSDGADAQLFVVSDDAETLVSRFVLKRASATFQPWRVDLSAWAGEEVTLKLATEARGSPWADYVFFGAPTVYGGSDGPVRRVVVIGMDTTRPDHLGVMGYERDTSPELDRFAERAVVFERAWTPAPRTRPSFRSATTGRNPLDAVGAPPIGSVFRAHGFATAAYVSNVHLRPRFGFHRGFDAWIYDGLADAGEQVDRAITWLDHYADRDTYLFLHLMDPHTAYRPPAAYRRRFVTEERDLPDRLHRWQVMNLQQKGKLDDADRRYLRELYDAEIAYTSAQLGRLFDHLDRRGDHTLVVVHSDHGEEFWEHGGFEHNHTLYDEVTRAVLLLRSGRGMAAGVRSQVPATLADIAPTLYDFAGFTEVPETDGRSLRPWLEDPSADPGWTRPLGVAHLRYGFERWGVVYDDHKYLVFTGSGKEELYDLRSDPSESKNLVESADRDRWRRLLAEAHEMPVGPGWRLHVDAARGSRPVVLELPEEPVQVEIIDPERTIPNPANQAWGDPPRRTLEEIGSVSVDGKTLTWTPGTNPRHGLIAVLFDEELDPALLEIRDRGLAQIRAEAGTVLFPPPSEAARMAALGELEQTSDIDQGMLEALGYVHPDDQ